MCGLPGSGKTTVALELESSEHAVRLCPDEWIAMLGGDGYDEALRERVEEKLWQLAVQLLERGVSVILENGFWTRRERDRLRLAARQLGVGVELRFLNVEINELWCRLALRNNALPYATFEVTKTALFGWVELFEPPGDEELALFDPPGDTEFVQRGGAGSNDVV
jgi:predicted kinase